MSPALDHRAAPPAPDQPKTRRRAAHAGVVGGGAAAGVSACLGAPWWMALCSVVCVVIAVLPALLPQESEHRRDVIREFLRHRERMYRLRHERPGRTRKRRTE
ncbi:hypothetical protein [Streptomyces sp. NPDC004546]|uniref:hypothetical protein n=1 Tax=Streptomyces sp. NPDC004546 TaxID=3154282 RepID=UPI0033B24175